MKKFLNRKDVSAFRSFQECVGGPEILAGSRSRNRDQLGLLFRCPFQEGFDHLDDGGRVKPGDPLTALLVKMDKKPLFSLLLDPWIDGR